MVFQNNLLFLLFYVTITNGDWMKRDDIILYLEIAIGILLIILAFKFFIAILPLIVVALIGLLIYDSYKKNNNKPTEKKKDKTVKEAEIIKEKKID